MPHIVLETTSDLQENAHVPDILDALVCKLSEFETIKPCDIKARHTLRSVWSMGKGAPAGFAHCVVAIMKGRPEELRAQIADGIYAALKEHFKESLELGEVGLSVEIREMDAATYRK